MASMQLNPDHAFKVVVKATSLHFSYAAKKLATPREIKVLTCVCKSFYSFVKAEPFLIYSLFTEEKSQFFVLKPKHKL